MTRETDALAPVWALYDEGAFSRALVAWIDATQGRKTRSIIVTDSNHCVLSAIQAETIAQRFDTNEDDHDN